MDEILGLVLYSIEYKEKGRIVNLYTKYGIKGVLVNNAMNLKSHNLAFCNTLNVLNFIATGKDLLRLKEYSVVSSYYELTEDLSKMDIVFTIIKVLKNIKVESVELNEKYLLFVISILDLLKKDISSKLLLAVFLIKSLKMFGIEPNFSSCISCQNPNIVFFSYKAGGVLCPNCTRHNNKDTILFDFKNIYYNKNIEDISITSNIEDLLKVISSYYQEHAYITLFKD